MLAVRRHLRWIAPVAVVVVAVVLRFWALDRPGTLVFDELFYVRDAISQLAHGYPTTWPDDDPSMAGARAAAFSSEASYAVHPPLGKWIIGLGILLFGAETGWGWRSAVALAGVVTVVIVMRLAWQMSRSRVVACLAGFFLAIDGVHVVLSRVALLDGILTSFITLGALFLWHDIETTPRPVAAGFRTRFPVLWNRPWLVAAAAAFGAAAAVKWSGLYPLAAFLIFVTIRDLAIRVRTREHHAVWRALLQAGATAALALPTAVIVYLASWTGWILSTGGWARDAGSTWIQSLLKYHADMLGWHGTLTAPHPYASNPLTWPLAFRPTAMYETRWSEGCQWTECVSGVSAIPNLFITWAGVAALIMLIALIVRRVRHLRIGSPVDPVVVAGTFVLVGYLSGWLPWVLTFSRSAVFQFYAVALTPFAAIALAIVCGMLCGIPVRSCTGVTGVLPLDAASEGVQGRRIAVALFVLMAGVLTVFFAPIWTGLPVADWFWQSHMWLPGWD